MGGQQTPHRVLVADHLEQALAEDTPSKKNYHVRSALQALALEAEDSRS